MPDMTIEQLVAQAMQHHQAGRLPQAEPLYREALAAEPNHPDALHYLGLLAYQSGHLDQALELMRRAITVKWSVPYYHGNMGLVLADLGRIDEAIAAQRQALRMRPDFPEANNNLGNVLKEKGQFAEARAAYERALAQRPDYPEALGNLGDLLRQMGLLDEAVACCRRSIAQRPDYSLAHNNLGSALMDQGEVESAVAAFRRAIALWPDSPEAHHNLGMALLLQGDFTAGFREYEWRERIKGTVRSNEWSNRPRWNGEEISGRTLIIHAEQGLGDTIQFSRYMPLAAARGAKVIGVCPPELLRLMRMLDGVERWLTSGDPLPAFDLHCPLLSLPRVFGTTLPTIPSKSPYLKANETYARQWRQRMETFSGKIKVGLSWAGRPEHHRDHSRSIALTSLAPLMELEHVQFFSLQKGEAAEQARDTGLVDYTHELIDFADTAGLIESLDLVITVDTAIAHLAGAMGKNVWTMLPFAADWRWLLDRSDTPWYPTMKLFRQPKLGDWPGVIGRIAQELACLVK